MVGASLAAFAMLAWRRFDFSLALVLFSAPLYLLKIIIVGLPLTVLELLILVIFIVWLIKKTKNHLLFDLFKKIDFGEIWLPILLILAGILIATMFSPDVKTSAGILKSWFVEPIIFGIVLIDTVGTKKQLGKLLHAILFSGTLVATISLVYLPTSQLTFDGRLRAFFLSPNQLAMYLAPSILICLGFLLQNENKQWRQAAAWCALPLGVSFYFTFSYAAWFGVLVALAIMFFVFAKWQGDKTKKALLACLLLLAILIAIFGYLQWKSPKLSDLLYSSRSSFQSRLMIWRSALEILKTHWFLGIGPGLFQKYYLAYQKYFPPYLEWAVPQPHNLFLAFWLQAGLLGFVGLVLLLINFFRKTLKNFFKTKQPLLLILAAVMIYILAHGLLDTTYWKNDLALIFWAIISLGYRAARLRD
jgi:O-antigen ligase